MNIERALKLKVRDIVYCPADRGDAACTGRVHIQPSNPTIHEDVNGNKFIWVSVWTFGKATIWPSHRLG